MHQCWLAAVRFIYIASVLHDVRNVSAITFIMMMVLSLPSPWVISNRCGEGLAPLEQGSDWGKGISMIPMPVCRLCGISNTIGRVVGMRKGALLRISWHVVPWMILLDVRPLSKVSRVGS